ncbi:MAG: response regulator [Anaerolineales bacterium]|nr:MAG: response regulator [Anaerolineales bacterium]
MSATILIVDDESHIRHLTARMLAMAGYQVIEAASGPEALRLIEESKPDVITCDIDMPGMDGFEVLKAIKSRPSTADTPVIMLTGIGQRKDAVQATELGASDYMTKPFGSTNLIETIERQLAARQEANE